jgi:hypothetical protein
VVLKKVSEGVEFLNSLQNGAGWRFCCSPPEVLGQACIFMGVCFNGNWPARKVAGAAEI